MSSKFNIELAQGTVTVEGDENFIKSVYQALQETLLSGNGPAAATADTAEIPIGEPVRDALPEPDLKTESAAIEVEEEAEAEAEVGAEVEIEAKAEVEAEIEAEAEIPHDENVTPIIPVEAASLQAQPEYIEEAAEAMDEDAAPMYEPIPSVLDPGRAEREKAEAKSMEDARVAEEAKSEPAPARSSVLEQINESLDDEGDSGSQTSILQRIRDSLSEDRDKPKSEEPPRAADAG